MTTLETKAKSGALTTPPALHRTLHALKVGLSTTKLILGYEVFKSLRLPAKEQETPDPKNSETVATKSESSFLQTIVDAAKYNITTAPLCAAAGTLTTVLYVSMPMAMSFASGWIVETITTKPEDLLKVGLVVLGAVVSGDLIGRFDRVLWSRLGQKMQVRSRSLLSKTVQRWSYQDLEDGRRVQDYGRVQRAFYRTSMMYMQTLFGAVSLANASFAIWYVSQAIDTRLALGFAGFLALRLFRDRRLAKLGFAMEKELDKAERRLDLALGLCSQPGIVRQLKQFGADRTLLEQLDKIGREVTAYRARTINSMEQTRGVYDFASGAIIATGVAALGAMNMEQTISAGVVVTLWGALSASFHGMRSISYNLGQLQEHHRFVADMLRFFFHDSPTTNQYANHPLQDNFSLTLEAVRVVFGEKCVLDVKDLTIEPGTIIGIVGKEGAGKSTLVKVLLNRLSATKGKVLVGSTENGRVEVSSVSPAEFERHAKTFMQDFVPPEGKSIRQLLELAQTSAPQGGITIDEACEITGVHEFLPKSADALDTVIGASWEQGQNFSGGQMKQIGLAMVLVSNPEVMVLDEPFANISSATADTILAKICEHVRGKKKTLIVISHNYGSFSHADRLLTIEKGCVTQYGRPSEIAHQEGAYLEGILDMVNPALRPLGYQLRYKKGVGLEMYEV